MDELDVDTLAQAIRVADGGHEIGAGAMAEALMPLIYDALAAAEAKGRADRLRTEADVRVKALEWGVNGADTGLGSLYYVRHHDDGTWGWHLTMGPDVPDRYSSPGEAKAAAQADYETRIRAALQGGDNE